MINKCQCSTCSSPTDYLTSEFTVEYDGKVYSTRDDLTRILFNHCQEAGAFNLYRKKKEYCKSLLSSLLNNPELEQLWWDSTNLAFSNQTPNEVFKEDRDRVFNYLNKFIGNQMKLYELTRGDKFIVHPDVEKEANVYTFVKLDGMYSICLDKEKEVVHWSVSTPVIPVIHVEDTVND